jgi:chaperone required for assembly of F1-ATPase
MASSTTPLPGRFYKTCALAPGDRGFVLLLDGKPAKTPAGAVLAAPTAALGGLIHEEWGAQGARIDLSQMPATRLAFTAIDRTPHTRGDLVEEIARFADHDLLCYLADSPSSLTDRQERLWLPWLAWADQTLGARLTQTQGLVHAPQPEASLDRIRGLAEAEGDFALSGLAFACALFGSAVLAFAVRRGELDAVSAFELSRVEDAFQEAQWGVDSEAALRTEGLRRDARLAGAWFAAV